MKRFLIILLLLIPTAGMCQTPETAVLPDQIRVQADAQEYFFESQKFVAEGNVIITRGDETLSAARVIGDVMTGNLEATGDVRYTTPERTITGGSFVYNYRTQEGTAIDAAANQDNLYFTGQRIEARPGRYALIGSKFTTCGFEDPHYYLAARELIIEPGKQLTARGVSLYLLGNRLFTISRYTVDLTKGKESKGRLPVAGYSSRYGVYASYDFDLSRNPNIDSTLEVGLSTKHLLYGGLNYRRLDDKPIFARLTYKEPAYGDADSDTVMSRLPEVGLRYYSDADARKLPMRREGLDVSRNFINPLEITPETARIHTISEISAGYYVEHPNGASTERIDARALAWTRPVEFAPGTYFVPGASLRFSAYGTGDAYGVLGLSLGVGKRISPTSAISLAYITHAISGDTPFAFDRIEIKDELAGLLNFNIKDVKVEIRQRYNLNENRRFDTEISLSKEFHCLEPRITWHDRFNEVSFGVNLVGF